MFFFQTTFYFFNYKISFQILAQDNNTFWMIFIEFRDKKVWKKPPRAQILHYFCYQFRKNKNITIHVNTQYFLSMYHRKRITKKKLKNFVPQTALSRKMWMVRWAYPFTTRKTLCQYWTNQGRIKKGTDTLFSWFRPPIDPKRPTFGTFKKSILADQP